MRASSLVFAPWCVFYGTNSLRRCYCSKLQVCNRARLGYRALSVCIFGYTMFYSLCKQAANLRTSCIIAVVSAHCVVDAFSPRGLVRCTAAVQLAPRAPFHCLVSICVQHLAKGSTPCLDLSKQLVLFVKWALCQRTLLEVHCALPTHIGQMGALPTHTTSTGSGWNIGFWVELQQ